MPRLVGVDVPNEKRVVVSLTYIHGIGPHRAQEIASRVGIEPKVRMKDVTEDELARIASVIEEFETEGQLRRLVAQNINRLKEIGFYRGLRHRKSLPARGQRTKTNARTRKGPRKVVATKKSVKQMR